MYYFYLACSNFVSMLGLFMCCLLPDEDDVIDWPREPEAIEIERDIILPACSEGACADPNTNMFALSVHDSLPYCSEQGTCFVLLNRFQWNKFSMYLCL